MGNINRIVWRAAIVATSVLCAHIAIGWQQKPPSPAADAGLVRLDQEGRDLIKRGDLAGAEQFFRKAVEQARAEGNRAWEAEFERLIGETFERRFDYASARPFYEKALSIRLALGDKPGIALLQGGLGWVCHVLRDDAVEEQYLQDAISGYQELKDPKGQAKYLHLRAQLRSRQGRLDEAQQAVTKAISLYEEAGQKECVGCRGTLAEIYRLRAEYRQALETAFLAFDESRTGKDPQETARILDIIGNTFVRLEQPAKALDYYQQALSFKRPEDRQGRRTSYSNMGAALDKLGRHQEALTSLQRAMESSNGAADRAGTLLNMGLTQEALGQREEARKTLSDALAICESSGYKPQAGIALYSLGNLAMSEGNLKQALSDHQRGLEIRKSLNDRVGLVTSLNRLALIQEARGDLRAAEHLHRTALDEFQPLLRGISDPLQMSTFRETSRILYPHYAVVLARLNRPAEAFLMAERGRGAAMAQMANLSSTSFVDALTQPQREEWISSATALARATNRLRVAQQQSDHAGSRAADDARASYVEADRALSSLRDRIYASSSNLRGGAQERERTLEDYLALARRKKDTVFLEWLVVDGSSLLFMLSAQGGLQCFDLPTGRAEFDKLVGAWLSSMSAVDARGVLVPQRTADSGAELRYARKLYTAALGPAAKLLEQGSWSRLMLVGDGALLRFPFAALVDDSGRRWIDRYTIASSVSLRGLLSQAARPKPRRTMLAIGDPLSQGEDRVVAPFGYHVEALPYAKTEAHEIAQLFPDALLRIGPSAREAEVKKNLGQFAILHFATHGILSPDDGLRSGLVMATEPETGDEDGFLQAWEIATVPLSARLAVLSACQTAHGDERLGEGLVGLAWALQGAGCPNVVASLWSVNDASTRDLMVAFYRSLRDGDPLESALRKAMLDVRSKPSYASPYYWAAFRLFGPGGMALPRQ